MFQAKEKDRWTKCFKLAKQMPIRRDTSKTKIKKNEKSKFKKIYTSIF